MTNEKNKTVTLEVFYPPMCCSTGVCGPKVDTKLVQFSADLEWLKARFFIPRQASANPHLDRCIGIIITGYFNFFLR